MNHVSEQVSPGKVHFWLVITTVLWGGSFVFNKIGFRELHPLWFLALRFILAALIMGIVSLPRLSRLDRTILRKGALVGLALFAANLSFVIGVSGTTVSRAGFLNNLFVLIIPIVCRIVWGSPIDRRTTFGVILALVGLAAFAGGGSEGFNRGDFVSTLCAFFISFHIIVVSRVLKNEDVFLVSLVQFTVTALLGLATALLLAPLPTTMPGAQGIGSLVYCALFPTVICFTLQNTWQRHTTPSRAGLIYTLDPAWSLLGGMLILGERLSGREWIGCLLIFSAVAGPPLLNLLRERRDAASQKLCRSAR